MDEYEKASATHIVSDTKVRNNPKLFAYSKYVCIYNRLLVTGTFGGNRKTVELSQVRDIESSKII